MPDSPLKGGKLQPAMLQAAPEGLFPQGTQKPSTSHCTSLQRATSFLSKSWNPSSSSEWQSTTLMMLESLPPPQCTETQGFPLCLQESPCTPSKSRNSSPLAEERKEVVCDTTRILQGATYPAYPFLRKTAGIPGEKPSKSQPQKHYSWVCFWLGLKP
jgi:hypothetical protein